MSDKKRIMTAKKIYDELTQLMKDNGGVIKGQISLTMGGIEAPVCQKDSIGNMIQEWVSAWMTQKNISFDSNPNTQMPPDFFLNGIGAIDGKLEIKVFDMERGPGFDIGGFNAYTKELAADPSALYTDYLIFGYVADGKGNVQIKKIWLKKVWEIMCSSGKWPIKLQVKDEQVHKIRPATWYSKNPRFPVFATKEDFLGAIEETMYLNPPTHNDFATWKQNFNKKHKKLYDKKLTIPRWSDIESKYRPVKKDD